MRQSFELLKLLKFLLLDHLCLGYGVLMHDVLSYVIWEPLHFQKFVPWNLEDVIVDRPFSSKRYLLYTKSWCALLAM